MKNNLLGKIVIGTVFGIGMPFLILQQTLFNKQTMMYGKVIDENYQTFKQDGNLKIKSIYSLTLNTMYGKKIIEIDDSTVSNNEGRSYNKEKVNSFINLGDEIGIKLDKNKINNPILHLEANVLLDGLYVENGLE